MKHFKTKRMLFFLLSSFITFSIIANTHSPQLGYSALDLNTQTFRNYNATKRFPMCSTAKFIVVAAMLHKSINNPKLLSKNIHYTINELKESGYTPITKHALKKGMTILQLAESAIIHSDNLAMNLLIKNLGGVTYINRFARSIGDHTFRLDRIEPYLNSAKPSDQRDTTSPLAMRDDLQKILLGDVLPNLQRQLLRNWMIASETGKNRIQAATPAHWLVGDKTGTGQYGTTNDIGIIWPPHCKPIILSIYYTNNKKSAKSNEKVIVNTAKSIIHEFSMSGSCIKNYQ
jgi:beta-lactamase class A